MSPLYEMVNCTEKVPIWGLVFVLSIYLSSSGLAIFQNIQWIFFYKTKVWPFCLLRLRRQRMRNDSSLMSKRVYYQNLLFIFAFTKNAFQQKSALKWIPTSKLLFPSFLAIAWYTACVWLAQGKANVKYETFDWSTENYSQQ